MALDDRELLALLFLLEALVALEGQALAHLLHWIGLRGRRGRLARDRRLCAARQWSGRWRLRGGGRRGGRLGCDHAVGAACREAARQGLGGWGIGDLRRLGRAAVGAVDRHRDPGYGDGPNRADHDEEG